MWLERKKEEGKKELKKRKKKKQIKSKKEKRRSYLSPEWYSVDPSKESKRYTNFFSFSFL